MRIISGIYGGRKILMDDSLPIRPTSDKARGAVFSSIATLIPDSAILDIFAGTGAVGIEALSRGAKIVTAIEKSPQVAALIARNRDNLGIQSDQLAVIVGSFERELPRLEGSNYDVIFADPPYSKGYAQMVLELVAQHGLLHPTGVMIIEHFSKEEIAERAGDLRRAKIKNYGQTTMSYYLRGE
ncbi:MAG: 16S rRNA (guanine(966)-N(2))-methyltransferase RsmD [Bacillota bacterium]|nr:16S rRNA (guanine(966)-N(2))-methyltransferase RsmD [Bacillota bacterium]